MACNCINIVMPIFNVQPKTMDPSMPDPIPSPISHLNTQTSIPDLTAIVSSTYPNTHSSLVISGLFVLTLPQFCLQSTFLSNIKGPSMANQKHINPLLFVSVFLTDTDSSAPNYKTGVPSSSDSNTKSGSNLFGSDSGIYHPMELDKQSSEEYKGEDNEYLIADSSGLGVDDDTPPKRCKLAGKRQHIQSNVYDYFEKLNPSGEWVVAKGNFQFIYKCQHCSVKLAIIGCNTSNLNKHQGCCCGQFNAWASKAPGSVDPNMGAKIASEEQDSILKQLVEALIAIQVSFSIFEMPCLRQVLQ
ncbi:hypothetical protein O181_028529 [Austropuccinia psidii MF-1]|uniref:Uncharacterized protein n=1 Tax=Austropuccinia psidii MF-1 TaxID=1389203 RepID=A0A9Q3H3P2_9BASI|nr:hypothetical protein [Austropuccinia psidii MF-1]